MSNVQIVETTGSSGSTARGPGVEDAALDLSLETADFQVRFQTRLQNLRKLD